MPDLVRRSCQVVRDAPRDRLEYRHCEEHEDSSNAGVFSVDFLDSPKLFVFLYLEAKKRSSSIFISHRNYHSFHVLFFFFFFCSFPLFTTGHDFIFIRQNSGGPNYLSIYTVAKSKGRPGQPTANTRSFAFKLNAID